MGVPLVHVDNVRETATTTGTGNLTLAGATTGSLTFNASLSSGDCVSYRIQHATLNEWEVGIGTFTAAATLARTTVIKSSNANNAVDLSAGTKYVSIVPVGSVIGALDAVAAHIFSEQVADAAASTTRVARVFYASAATQITTVSLFMDATVTGHGTNYKTFDLKKFANGGAISAALATQIATSSTPAGDLTARTAAPFTLTGSKIDLAAGETLCLEIGVAAAGVQLPKFMVIGAGKLTF